MINRTMERVLATGSWVLNPGRWVDSLLNELEKLREVILPAEASFSRDAQARLRPFAD
jgi:hypothetical protein